MSINIIAIGRTKQSYLKEGIAEFEKRIKRYTRIKLIELPDVKAGSSGVEAIKKMEAELLKKYMRERDYLIVLDERGKEFNTPAFADFLEAKLRRDINFVIGGAFGLDKSILDRADFVLSFSQFTFTHQMIRLLLYEQLYRVFNLLEGGSYHK